MKYLLGRAALLAAAAMMPGTPAAVAQEASAPVDLSGFWELRNDSKRVGEAVLVEGFAESDSQRRFNDIVTYPSRWCHPLGTPFIMGDSAPLDLIQNARELAITAEVQSSPRHIYIDGREAPDMEAFDPTTNGYSIGRWEGEVLVVETVGFNEIGNRMIPGGGLRGETSRLVERYELSEDGQQLNIHFTWEDPRVFAEPHSYDFTYYRAADDEYAREYFCDASDEGRGGTVTEPEQ